MAKRVANFDDGLQGWQTIDNGTPLEHVAFGGSSGGYVSAVDAGSGLWMFEGGGRFTGDLTGFYGGRISYAARIDGSAPFGEQDIALVGANGTTITYQFDTLASADWTTFAVRLDQYSGWRINGAIASETDIVDVLSDVVSFRIRGDRQIGTDRSDLDTVRLTSPQSFKGISPATDRPDLLRSTFEKGGEGWGFVADLDYFTVERNGGVGGSRFLNATDQAAGQIIYFVAPIEYSGTKTGFYGGEISYSLKTTNASSPIADADVRIVGANGTTLVHHSGQIPGANWTGYSVKLAVGEWTIGSISGDAATRKEIKGVLEDIAALQIRGEYNNGAETVGIDDVTFRAPKRPFDIYLSSDDDSLVATTSHFGDALQAARPGNVINVGKYTSGTWNIEANRLEVHDSGGKLSGQLNLRVETFRAEGTGNLRVIGDSSDNEIAVKSPGAREITMAGKSGNDMLYGEAMLGFTARILGGGGRDRLVGGASDDVLDGGTGNDRLTGGAGNDQLHGYWGNDRFVFGPNHGRDKIFDFRPGQDKVVLDGFPGIQDYGDLEIRLNNRGKVTILTDNGDRIVLENIESLNRVDADDFMFSG